MPRVTSLSIESDAHQLPVEVRQKFADWVDQAVRIYEHANFHTPLEEVKLRVILPFDFIRTVEAIRASQGDPSPYSSDRIGGTVVGICLRGESPGDVNVVLNAVAWKERDHPLVNDIERSYTVFHELGHAMLGDHPDAGIPASLDASFDAHMRLVRSIFAAACDEYRVDRLAMRLMSTAMSSSADGLVDVYQLAIRLSWKWYVPEIERAFHNETARWQAAVDAIHAGEQTCVEAFQLSQLGFRGTLTVLAHTQAMIDAFEEANLFDQVEGSQDIELGRFWLDYWPRFTDILRIVALPDVDQSFVAEQASFRRVVDETYLAFVQYLGFALVAHPDGMWIQCMERR